MGAGGKELEVFAQDSRRFWCHKSRHIKQPASKKEKKTKHVKSSSKMPGRKIDRLKTAKPNSQRAAHYTARCPQWCDVTDVTGHLEGQCRHMYIQQKVIYQHTDSVISG